MNIVSNKQHMLIDLFEEKKEKEIAHSTYVSYGMLD
jgi:hypothetical protein